MVSQGIISAGSTIRSVPLSAERLRLTPSGSRFGLWLKGLLLAATVGAFAGALELWFFEWSLPGLFAAAGAGACFGVLWTVLAYWRSARSAHRRQRVVGRGLGLETPDE